MFDTNMNGRNQRSITCSISLQYYARSLKYPQNIGQGVTKQNETRRIVMEHIACTNGPARRTKFFRLVFSIIHRHNIQSYITYKDYKDKI